MNTKRIVWSALASVGMVVLGGVAIACQPQTSAQNPSTGTSGPGTPQATTPVGPVWHNCLTREVWSPEKQAWCGKVQTLSNATYPISNLGEQFRTVTLRNGSFEDRNASLSVTLVNRPGYIHFADLNGDRSEDGLVTLGATFGASGQFTYLSVAPSVNGQLRPVSTVFLGDRIQIQSIQVRNGQIFVDLITQGPNDPLCCPTLRVVQTYEVRNNQLRLVSQRPFGNPSVQARSGYAVVPLSQVPAVHRRPSADPKATAIAAFGIPENQPIEGNFQQTVSVDESNPTQRVVTITQTNLPDDSVQSVRYRLEFSSVQSASGESLWRMTWVGRQQICRLGRGAQDWSAEVCL